MSSTINNGRPKLPRTTARISTHRPTCEVIIYRYNDKRPLSIVSLSAADTQKIDGSFPADNLTDLKPVVINNDIASCVVSKSKASPVGTFKVMLKRGRVGSDQELTTQPQINYLDTINPGDWIAIFMKKNNKGGITLSHSTDANAGLKMIGIVEDVRLVESDDPANGTPRQEIQVTGKDFAKVFEDKLFFNPIMNAQLASTVFGVSFLQESLNAIVAANNKAEQLPSPDQVMKSLISFFFGGTFDKANREFETRYIPSNLYKLFKPSQQQAKARPSFIDILDYESQVGLVKGTNVAGPLPGKTFIKSIPSQGTIWNVLEFFSNNMINELYLDLYPVNGKLIPTLFFRQIPFSNKGGSKLTCFAPNSKLTDVVSDSQKAHFVDLPSLKIDSSDLKGKNIGKSDIERVNHVVVIPRIDSPIPVAYEALFNYGSVQRYGLRSIVGETSYPVGSENTLKSYCSFCTYLLADWFFNADQLYSGTLTIEGRDEHVHVGQNIFITDIGELFHVEAYSHNYEVNPGNANATFTTTFQVSRGIQYSSGQLGNFISNSGHNPHTVVQSVIENLNTKRRL